MSFKQKELKIAPPYFLLCIADSLSNTTARSSNDKASIQ
jgi:hypothetical protein